MYICTSQNAMYCGGEPEHKRIANKCMREEIQQWRVISRVHNIEREGTLGYIELHTQNKCTCHESSLGCLQITCARYYKFHTMLLGAQCLVALVKLFLLVIDRLAFLV